MSVLPAMPVLIAAIEAGTGVDGVSGAVTAAKEGPPPTFVHSLDDLMPARDLLRHRRKYFLGTLDPCASIEFSRGCPWDCNFCSAWTFYGRSYRIRSADAIVDDLSRVREPGVFIVDDVAFIQAKQGMAIGEAIARRGINKQYYLETRGDVLLRNKEVFQFWKTLGLAYMFIGIEAIDEEGLALHRKRITLSKNFEALDFARSLGITVAINLIADPSWDRRRFDVVRQWCLEIPEIVNISVNTPYPGTESWHTEARRVTTRDYRLYDIQHVPDIQKRILLFDHLFVVFEPFAPSWIVTPNGRLLVTVQSEMPDVDQFPGLHGERPPDRLAFFEEPRTAHIRNLRIGRRRQPDGERCQGILARIQHEHVICGRPSSIGCRAFQDDIGRGIVGRGLARQPVEAEGPELSVRILRTVPRTAPQRR